MAWCFSSKKIEIEYIFRVYCRSTDILIGINLYERRQEVKLLPKPTSIQTVENETVFQYDGSELDSIIEGVKNYFENRKYRLELGQPAHGTYGAGSNTLRVLFGGFVKRFSFSVRVTKDDQGPVFFRLQKAMSGAMGGVLGYSKMKKEYNAIVGELSAGAS